MQINSNGENCYSAKYLSSLLLEISNAIKFLAWQTPRESWPKSPMRDRKKYHFQWHWGFSLIRRTSCVALHMWDRTKILSHRTVFFPTLFPHNPPNNEWFCCHRPVTPTSCANSIQSANSHTQDPALIPSLPSNSPPAFRHSRKADWLYWAWQILQAP